MKCILQGFLGAFLSALLDQDKSGREFCERMPAPRAYQMGMVNRVVPRAELEQATFDIAERVAQMPRLGLQLTKQAVNNAEDLMGKRATMDMVFGLHHFAHAHNELISGDKLGGYDAQAMADSQRKAQA
jgi:enoyl-CoA hydratase